MSIINGKIVDEKLIREHKRKENLCTDAKEEEKVAEKNNIYRESEEREEIGRKSDKVTVRHK